MTGFFGKRRPCAAEFTLGWNFILFYVFWRETSPINHTSLARLGLKHLKLETPRSWTCSMSCNDSKLFLLIVELLVFIRKTIQWVDLMLGPVRKILLFCKSIPSVKEAISSANDFLASRISGGLKFFVRRQILFDSYTSSADFILRTWPIKIARVSGRFPFVRTDRPDHSRNNENFTSNQNYPARSVKF